MKIWEVAILLGIVDLAVKTKIMATHGIAIKTKTTTIIATMISRIPEAVVLDVIAVARAAWL